MNKKLDYNAYTFYKYNPNGSVLPLKVFRSKYQDFANVRKFVVNHPLVIVPSFHPLS